MFSGFHVTRPTRKDSNGKVVKFEQGMAPREGADGVKKNGKGETVDLFVSKIQLPETPDDIVAMLTDPKWLQPTEKVSYGFTSKALAVVDGDEDKREVAPIVALLVNAMKLAKNAEVNSRIAPKGMVKANRSKAELHWVQNDQAGYLAMIVACGGDGKVKDSKLDEYYQVNLAE